MILPQLRSVLMSMAHANNEDHVDVYGLHCLLGTCWCLLAVFLPGTTLMRVACTATYGMLMSVVWLPLRALSGSVVPLQPGAMFSIWAVTRDNLEASDPSCCWLWRARRLICCDIDDYRTRVKMERHEMLLWQPYLPLPNPPPKKTAYTGIHQRELFWSVMGMLKCDSPQWWPLVGMCEGKGSALFKGQATKSLAIFQWVYG